MIANCQLKYVQIKVKINHFSFIFSSFFFQLWFVDFECLPRWMWLHFACYSAWMKRDSHAKKVCFQLTAWHLIPLHWICEKCLGNKTILLRNKLSATAWTQRNYFSSFHEISFDFLSIDLIVISNSFFPIFKFSLLHFLSSFFLLT